MAEEPLTKPAEMSFSDWKKMKSALTANGENRNEKKSNNRSSNSKSNNNNSQRNNVNPNRKIMEHETKNYYANLNYLRMANQMGNMGFIGNQMLLMQSLNGMMDTKMTPYKNNNKMPPFNNDMTPFNNNMGRFNNNMINNNNFGSFNNNMGGSYNNNNNMAGSYNNNYMAGPYNNRNIAGPYNNNNMRSSQNNLTSNNNTSNPRQTTSKRPIPSLLDLNINARPSNLQNQREEFFGVSDKPLPQQVRNRSNRAKISTKKTTKPPNESNPKKDEAPASSSQQQQPVTAEKKPKKQKRPWNMPKPQMPPSIVALTPEAIEAKKRMWREYREKMKQFKNRDYQNAKRTVQRLKKKNFEELDEKDKERFEKANEYVIAHKKKLSERAQVQNVVDPAQNAEIINKNTSNIQVNTLSASVASSSYPLTSYNSHENEHFAPNNSEAAVVSKPYGLWNSFVPGGVLFDRTG